MLGIGGKVPQTLNIPAGASGLGNMVASDEFNRKPGQDYRFALFAYATKTIGGFVDFDYFRVSETIAGAS